MSPSFRGATLFETLLGMQRAVALRRVSSHPWLRAALPTERGVHETAFQGKSMWEAQGHKQSNSVYYTYNYIIPPPIFFVNAHSKRWLKYTKR